MHTHTMAISAARAAIHADTEQWKSRLDWLALCTKACYAVG